MRSVRALLVAFYLALSIWLVSLGIADARDHNCNPDDLTECDALGDALLGLSLLLPAVLVPLLVLLCVATVGLLTEMEAKEWIRQPFVVVVIGTAGLLVIVLAIAVFGNLEALF
jgi:hypothetical protein